MPTITVTRGALPAGAPGIDAGGYNEGAWEEVKLEMMERIIRHIGKEPCKYFYLSIGSEEDNETKMVVDYAHF
jgi:hypothetical protein